MITLTVNADHHALCVSKRGPWQLGGPSRLQRGAHLKAPVVELPNGYRIKSLVIPLCYLICFLLPLICFCLGDCVADSFPSRAQVVAVLDGDTVLLDSGQKLRYLGIDAPEVAHEGTPAACFGNEAKAANTLWVKGKEIRMEYEGLRHDSHGRLMAYVFLKDGRCVNRELVRSGLAAVYGKPENFRLWYDFLKCQIEALNDGRGMWGACRVKEEPFYQANTTSHVFHRPGCSFIPHRVSNRWKCIRTRLECLKLGYSPCRRCMP